MSLLKTLDELSKKTKRVNPYCAYKILYDSLPVEDRKALDSAIQKGMPVSLLVQALRQEKHKTSNDSVRAHVKGLCKCPKN
jgi:hypothetical protein